MKMKYRLLLVFSVLALLALLECIINCSCELETYQIPQRATILDNTKYETLETFVEEHTQDKEIVETENTNQEKQIVEEELISEPEQITETEQTVENEQPVETEQNVEPETTDESEQTDETEQTIETEQIAETEQTVETEQIVEPATTDESEQTDEIEQTVETEQITETEQTIENEQTVESETIDETEQNSELEQTDKTEQITDTEQIVEPETTDKTKQNAEPETTDVTEQSVETEQITETEQIVETEEIPETEQTAESEETTETEQTDEPEQITEIEQPVESETTDEIEQPADTEQTVEPEPPLKALTLLVYMAADNELESYALTNLKQMEWANYENMNVLVLLDRSEDYDKTNGNWTDTRLFEVAHDENKRSYIISQKIECEPLGLSKTSSTELDMGDYNVLKTFIEFARANYTAEKYALIIWGHGTGWRYSNIENPSSRAVAIDDNTNSYICIKDLGTALKNQELSVIGFDCCFGSVFENLYELKNCAQYIAACPGLSPSVGWNYNFLLQTLSASDFSAEEIASAMKQSTKAQITITKTSEISKIMNALENFSKVLSTSITNEETRKAVLTSLINTKSYSNTQYPCDIFIDINAMAQLYTNCTNEQLKLASENLANATDSLQIGLHLIEITSSGVLASSHSQNYRKNTSNTSQCAFIKESIWWVPTISGYSGSLLDKLFYRKF